MADIQAVKKVHEQQLMQVRGVEGVGIGVDEIGNPAIVVYTSSADVAKHLPQRIEGFKVKVENLKGPIVALPAGH